METYQTTVGIASGNKPLFLGRVGENLAREIVFDCAPFAALYGAGTALLFAKLPSGEKYPVAAEQSGSIVRWTLTAADVGAAGSGQAELQWLVGNQVAKTQIFPTIISRSLTGTEVESPPDPYEDWVDRIAAVGAQATIDAASAASSAESAAAEAGFLRGASATAETLEPGSSATVSLADGVFAFGLPRGETGPTGATGPAGKSAYSSAQDGGYTGSEQQFYSALANAANAEPRIKLGSISLSSSWEGNGPYTQAVSVSGAVVAHDSKIDLQPDAAALAQLLGDGVQALQVINNNGVLTAVAVGAATSAALTIQCTVTEVS